MVVVVWWCVFVLVLVLVLVLVVVVGVVGNAGLCAHRFVLVCKYSSDNLCQYAVGLEIATAPCDVSRLFFVRCLRKACA